MKFTDRLGLQIPAMGDELTAQRNNWNRLDQAFSGAIWVTAGTIPDDSILFEGALIAEIGTGKIWRAIKNITGQYDQVWVKYPWYWYGGRVGTFTGKDIWSRFAMGSLPVDSSKLVNSSATADLDSTGALVIPVDGIYAVHGNVRFEPNTDTAGFRGFGLAYNDSGNPTTPELSVTSVREPVLGASFGTGYNTNVSQVRYFSKGVRIVPTCYNSGTLNFTDTTVTLEVAMVKPISRDA